MQGKCHKEKAEDAPSLFQNGNLVFQAHHVGWIIAGFFTVIATITSWWLVNKHLQWYTNKREQRYIVRLLFMVPVYAIISFASYLFWNHSTPLLLIRDMYESTVLTAFFYLLLVYLSPNPEEQKAIFLKVGLSRQVDDVLRKQRKQITKWMFPLGFVKWKPADGLFFLQLMKWGVLQYCVIRPLTTVAAVVLDYMSIYCEESWSPSYGHIYITLIVSISVTIAMYCLIQLYLPVAIYLAPHKPLLKLFAVKAVVFLTFWQATFLSVLSMFGVVKNTKYMTASDINIAIGALLETFEMMVFAFIHIKAFSYKPYRPFHAPNSRLPPPNRTPRLRSLGHAMDFRETFREIQAGFFYIVDRLRGKEPVADVGAKRSAHYETAFGRLRPSQRPDNNGSRLATTLPTQTKASISLANSIGVNRRVSIDVEGERQWLGIGDDYGYGIGYLRKERSEGLEQQIEAELRSRGLTNDLGSVVCNGRIGLHQPSTHQPQRSWWRNVYDRLSHSGSGVEQGEFDFTERNQTEPRNRTIYHRQSDQKQEIDDPPPLGLMHPHRLRNQPRQYLGYMRTESDMPGSELDAPAPSSLLKLQKQLRGTRQTTKVNTYPSLSDPRQSEVAPTKFPYLYPSGIPENMPSLQEDNQPFLKNLHRPHKTVTGLYDHDNVSAADASQGSHPSHPPNSDNTPRPPFLVMKRTKTQHDRSRDHIHYPPSSRTSRVAFETHQQDSRIHRPEPETSPAPPQPMYSGRNQATLLSERDPYSSTPKHADLGSPAYFSS